MSWEGHSLLATRAAATVRWAAGDRAWRSVILFTIMPTVGELSVVMEAGMGGEGGMLPALSLRAGAGGADSVIVHAQERLWFIDRLEGSVQYHLPAVLRLTGRIGPGRGGSGRCGRGPGVMRCCGR